MTAALLSLLAALTAALITRSVMISNHRQAWINALRDDIAAFFTAIDVVHFRVSILSRAKEATALNDQQKARNDALLAYRKILMRLNMNEQLHQDLEKKLESLLTIHGNSLDQDALSAAIKLARTILKHEWEVTKYGLFSTPIIRFKAWQRERKYPGE